MTLLLPVTAVKARQLTLSHSSKIAIDSNVKFKVSPKSLTCDEDADAIVNEQSSVHGIVIRQREGPESDVMRSSALTQTACPLSDRRESQLPIIQRIPVLLILFRPITSVG